MSNTIILNIVGLSKDFGGVKALRELDLEVQERLIQAVIGPNGAGKTTLFNVISGVIAPTGGSVFFKGEEITDFPTHRIAQRGLTRTFQNLQLFADMTVLENVMVGMHRRSRGGFFASALKTPGVIAEERRIRDESMEWLRFVGMEEHSATAAGSLPFGNQRILELARGLASRPELLMLDEPAAGLNTRETEDLAQLIIRIKDSGVTVLLVEHDMELVMSVSDHVTVIDQGHKIAEGEPDSVRNDENVLKAYLGEE
ncbi:ABC transporter ATP-binding protein [bacterium]|nr:ABC transporter ATP-binding protein [bacterium]